MSYDYIIIIIIIIIIYKVKSLVSNQRLLMYPSDDDDDLIKSNTLAFDHHQHDDEFRDDILCLPVKDVSSTVFVKLRDKGNVKVNYLQCNSRKNSSNSSLSSTPSSSLLLNKSEMSTHLTRLANLLGLENSHREFISKKCKLAKYTKGQVITTNSSSSNKISLIVDGNLTLVGEHGSNALHEIRKGHLLGAGILS